MWEISFPVITRVMSSLKMKGKGEFTFPENTQYFEWLNSLLTGSMEFYYRA